jgi:hypothetical protein
MEFGGDRLGDRQQLDLLALSLFQPLYEKRLRALAAWRLIASASARSAAPRRRALVQHLGHADRPAVAVAQRHAQDVAGPIAGAPVDLRVKASILVGVGDDLGGVGAEHGAGDAGIGRDADLGHAVAAQHPRKQLVGIAVVQKQRRPLGIERLVIRSINR